MRSALASHTRQTVRAVYQLRHTVVAFSGGRLAPVRRRGQKSAHVRMRPGQACALGGTFGARNGNPPHATRSVTRDKMSESQLLN
jgi:hypothetical protein